MSIGTEPLSAIVAAVALTLSSTAQAQRTVIVNGERLDDAQIAWLEGVACTSIPDGVYWVDRSSGAWGYAGNPRPMGHVGEACGQTRRHRSLSERRLLYAPGEILGGR